MGSTSKWDKGLPNNYLIIIISNVMSSVMNYHDGGEWESRTELNSHVNMVVVRNHATILVDNGNKVDVSLFAPDYQAL